MNLAVFFLTEAPMPDDQGFMQTAVMLGIALVLFYLILWRPEQKRRKAQEAQRAQLKKGDRVNVMGILGTVDDVKESTFILETVSGAKIECLKAAIAEMTPKN